MKKRYLLIWTPWALVHEAAVKRGMEDDGSVGSVWDYVDITEFERSQVYSSFTAALAIARGKRSCDVWKEPRIYEQHDQGYGWDSVRFWEVTPGIKKSDAIAVE